MYDQAVTTKKQKIEERSELQKFHNTIKRNLVNKFAKKNEILFDFASGRGGDLPKLLHINLAQLIQIDVSEKSIEDAKERYDLVYKYLAKKTIVSFKVQDLSKSYLHTYKANVISCMFALHYFFETQEICNQFFKNVSNNLEVDGIFFGCVPDGKKILSLLNGNSKYENEILKIEANFKEKNCFGSQYSFQLKDSILSDFQSKEYLVFENVMIKIAQKHGLIAITNYTFPNIELTDIKLLKHFIPNLKTQDENDTSSIFATFAFQKKL